MTLSSSDTRWRATGPYLPINASKAGLFEETRQFLLTYSTLGSAYAAAAELTNNSLFQRSRETRRTIVKIIKARLIRWSPPEWVLSDLAATASSPDTDALKAALLLHVARQDTVLYDLVLQFIVPRWGHHERKVSRADVQSFLDRAEPSHPEIVGWTRETREKLAGNTLSILRDYGLLVGTATKQVVEPIVPGIVVDHLARLLLAEGVGSSELHRHPDWRLWLWEPERTVRSLAALSTPLEVPHA